MTISYEEKQELYKKWRKEFEMEMIREDIEKYRSRLWTKRVLEFIAKNILQNGIPLAVLIGAVVLGLYALSGLIWAIIHACRVF